MKITKLILTLLFLPLGAFALDPPIEPIETVKVSSEDDFEHRSTFDGCWSLQKNTDYILTQNVKLTRCLHIGATIRLDLNGYTLSRNLDNLFVTEKALIFRVDRTLIIEDSNKSENNRGIIAGDFNINTGIPAILVNDNGSAFLLSGIINVTEENLAIDLHGSLQIDGGSVYSYGTGITAHSGSKVEVFSGSVNGNNRGIVAKEGSKVTLAGGSFNTNSNYAVEAFEDINISGTPYFPNYNALVLSNGKKINIVGELKDKALINVNIAEPLTDKNPKIALSGQSEYITNDAIANKIFRHVTAEPTGYQLYAYNNTLMLRKDYPAIRYITEDGKTTAYIDGDYYGSVGDVEEKHVDSVVFERKFPLSANGYSTIMLPFAVKLGQLGGVKNIYYFRGVEEVNGKMEVQVQNLKDGAEDISQVEIQAYRPYLIQMESETLKIKGAVEIKSNNSYTVSSSGLWFFNGNDEFLEFTSEHVAGDNIYGFNDQVTENFKTAGQFVKIGTGAAIPPFRAFIFTRDIFGPEFKETKRPATMDVVIVESTNGNEHTTVIGRIDTRTGEFKMNRNYDLKGRKLNGTHQARGAYYGKKVLVK
ncbi:hypothetical protein SAMN05720487_10677 [Fibrobacter sp. UWT2]|uniref:hypothetical protein n=1 Tax=Fibrobacter sp. UWT2 TaxID=1896224 RepID=UPI0009190E4B|nr:hypothetical protein [Fibrobacter sp. UWT2]SHK96463.1 hypothetical protein SAMN05720487_10677 [Fibrobacter sp. UWT2]